jgi:hypothetical protein
MINKRALIKEKVIIPFLKRNFLAPEKFFKGIVSKLTIKMWQNERLQQKNNYKCCRMVTNTLDMIMIAK